MRFEQLLKSFHRNVRKRIFFRMQDLYPTSDSIPESAVTTYINQLSNSELLEELAEADWNPNG